MDSCIDRTTYIRCLQGSSRRSAKSAIVVTVERTELRQILPMSDLRSSIPSMSSRPCKPPSLSPPSSVPH